MQHLLLVLVILLPSACGTREEPDAYGNFEATEVVVSAETSGQLLWFTPDDGKQLAAGARVALVDTVQLGLERSQLLAQQRASVSRANEVAGQISLLQAQLDIAQRSYERTRRLHAEKAATALALDQAEREFRTLSEQLAVTRAQRQTAAHDVASSAARLAQLEERIRKSQVINPRSGTVLTTFAEAGEFVQQGQPLYKLAILDSMELRAYITEPQLSQVKIGQAARVTVDNGSDERSSFEGTVSWISAEAEFTPTPVQTRDERADLVYAVKIKVPNTNGVLKIGMPADVEFGGGEAPPQ